MPVSDILLQLRGTNFIPSGGIDMQFIGEAEFKEIVTNLTGVQVPTSLPASSVQLTRAQAQLVVEHSNANHGTQVVLAEHINMMGVSSLYRVLQLNHGALHGVAKLGKLAA